MIKNPALGPTLEELQKDTSGTGFFAKLLPSLIGLGLVIGVIVFFFVFAIGAIQWIFSGGDKGAIESARAKINNSLIGLVILFAAFAVALFIEKFFDINILTLDIAGLRIE